MENCTVEKRQFTFNESDDRFFVCDMANKGVGIYFGLIGALASDYLQRMYIEERALIVN